MAGFPHNHRLYPLVILIGVCQYVDMVCTYCSSETAVTNSRLQKRSNSVWRRRKCLNPECAALFSTSESVDYEKSWVVQYADSSLSPFLRDKLFVSIYNSLRHRKNALDEAIGLTGSVISILGVKITDGRMPSKAISQEIYRILGRFDKAAAVSYQAFHADVI